MREGLRALALALLALSATGCVNLGTGPTVQQYFVLEDAGGVAAARDVPDVPLSLVVTGSAAQGFYDAENLAYSRTQGQRAYYQLAAWTERPGRRIADIVRERLRSRGHIATVASATSGVRADLVLDIVVEEFFHDATVSPSQARVVLACEIVDWNTRAQLGRKRFEAAAELASEDAAGAAAALARATGSAVDALVPWVEGIAAGAAAAR